MAEYRVSFTRLTLEYFEVDVQALDGAHAEHKAEREIRAEPRRYQMDRVEKTYIPTFTRQL